MYPNQSVLHHRISLARPGIAIGALIMLSACFNSSDNNGGSDFSEFFPATIDCETVASTPADILDLDTSQTPRSSKIAERLALEASGEVVAPQSVYTRVVAELSGLQNIYSDSTVNEVSSCRPPQRLELHFDQENYDQVKDNTYSNWDALNDLLGMNNMSFDDAEQRVTLRFSGRYNINRISQEYATLEGILGSAPISPEPDGNDICLAIRDDFHFYIFRQGLNCDDETGCDQARYMGARVDNSGNAEQAGLWDGEGQAPDWYDNAEDCRVFLTGDN